MDEIAVYRSLVREVTADELRGLRPEVHAHLRRIEEARRHDEFVQVELGRQLADILVIGVVAEGASRRPADRRRPST